MKYLKRPHELALRLNNYSKIIFDVTNTSKLYAVEITRCTL